MQTKPSPRAIEALRQAWQRLGQSQQGLRYGLLIGGIGVFVALAGLLEFFSAWDVVSNIFQASVALLVLPAFIAGVLATRPAKGRAERPPTVVAAIVSAGLAGLLVGGILALLALLVNGVNMRDILVNATPALVRLLTFGLPIGPGVAILIGGGLLVGALGGGFHYLPSLHRRAIGVAVAAVLAAALLRDFLRPLLFNMGLGRAQVNFIYAGKGLTTWSALILLALGPALVYLIPWLRRVGGTRIGQMVWLALQGVAVLYIALTIVASAAQRWLPEQTVLVGKYVLWGVGSAAWVLALIFLPTMSPRTPSPPRQRRLPQVMPFFLVLAVLLVLPYLLGEFASDIVNRIGLAVLMGLGLNIVVGFAGLLDLGYVAFYAIGAYFVGYLTNTDPDMTLIGWSFWAALPLAVIAAALAGVLLGIPVLRMRGDYLAIVTLGFGEIISRLVKSDLLKPITGGAQGIDVIPKPEIFGQRLVVNQQLYYLILVGVLLALYVSVRLAPSRIGRAWMAIREDEDVAEAIGINLVAHKLLAFATGAAFSGLAGALFAGKVGSDNPASFALLVSINALCLIIVGGMGSIPGVIVGAIILFGLPEVLQVASEYRMLFYGALLVIMMLARPEGFWPARRQFRRVVEETAAESGPRG